MWCRPPEMSGSASEYQRLENVKADKPRGSVKAVINSLDHVSAAFRQDLLGYAFKPAAWIDISLFASSKRMISWISVHSHSPDGRGAEIPTSPQFTEHLESQIYPLRIVSKFSRRSVVGSGFWSFQFFGANFKQILDSVFEPPRLRLSTSAGSLDVHNSISPSHKTNAEIASAQRSSQGSSGVDVRKLSKTSQSCIPSHVGVRAFKDTHLCGKRTFGRPTVSTGAHDLRNQESSVKTRRTLNKPPNSETSVYPILVAAPRPIVDVIASFLLFGFRVALSTTSYNGEAHRKHHATAWLQGRILGWELQFIGFIERNGSPLPGACLYPGFPMNGGRSPTQARPGLPAERAGPLSSTMRRAG
ncbi:hypothetical protein C8R43DRAFT_965208 [Mycena crocata]|nr:hypothetical protein C8R43DRAFT_965208 [Mycena crocata]